MAVLLFSFLIQVFPLLAGLMVGTVAMLLANQLPLVRAHARAIVCFHCLLGLAGFCLGGVALGIGLLHSPALGLQVFLAGALLLGATWLSLTLLGAVAGFAGRRPLLPTLPEGLE